MSKDKSKTSLVVSLFTLVLILVGVIVGGIIYLAPWNCGKYFLIENGQKDSSSWIELKAFEKWEDSDGFKGSYKIRDGKINLTIDVSSIKDAEKPSGFDALFGDLSIEGKIKKGALKVGLTVYARDNADVTHTVKFDSQGGSEVRNKDIKHGKKLTAPRPTYNDIDFLGWYNEPNFQTKFDFNSGVYGSKTLYARWDAYYINLGDFEGGTVTGGGAHQKNSQVTLTAIPDDDHVFDGWYSIYGSEISREKEYRVTVYTDIDIVPRFKEKVVINSKADLLDVMNDFDNYGFYKLGADIDFEGEEWTNNANFYGVFDGNGFTIRDIDIGNNSFIRVNYGTVKNLGLVETIGKGGLISSNIGTLENCFISGEIEVEFNEFNNINRALLVNDNSGLIKNCYASGAVTVTSTTYCYNAAVGGLVAMNYKSDGVIENCFSTVDVTVNLLEYNDSTSYVGGLVGLNTGEIKNCLATGDVATSVKYAAYIGGLVGGDIEGTVTNCYRLEGQSISAVVDNIEGTTALNTDGTECTIESLDTAAFYTSTLKLEGSVWDLTGLDFADGSYPSLKIFA